MHLKSVSDILLLTSPVYLIRNPGCSGLLLTCRSFPINYVSAALHISFKCLHLLSHWICDITAETPAPAEGKRHATWRSWHTWWPDRTLLVEAIKKVNVMLNGTMKYVWSFYHDYLPLGLLQFDYIWKFPDSIFRSLLRKWKHIGWKGWIMLTSWKSLFQYFPSSLRLSLFCLSAGCCNNLEMLKWNCTINLFFFDPFHYANNS